jgi:hypothetical protein
MDWIIAHFSSPEDEDGDGPRNVGFIYFQPLEAAGSPGEFYYT